MAKKPTPATFQDGIFWLDIADAAKRLGTTQRKMLERALAGEFRYLEHNGFPVSIAEPDIAPLRAAKLAADRAKLQSARRPKTPRQLEAEWAKLSAENAKAHPRGGAFTGHHLRMTLPDTEPKEPGETRPSPGPTTK